jgi:hypothetical protein
MTEEEIDFDQWDDSEYDVEGMKVDHKYGNFSPDNAEKYSHANMIQESFANGQFTQAKEFCARYGFTYELERYKFNGREA